jgi:hypothetical protein
MGILDEDPRKVRPIKVLERVDHLREVDRAISEELGGFTNRHDFYSEAAQRLLIDLRYGDPDSETASSADPEAERNGRGAEAEAKEVVDRARVRDRPERGSLPLRDIAETRITAPEERGMVAVNLLADAPAEPLFGMHNADAPSFWALRRLAEAAATAPVSAAEFYDEATEEAWKLGRLLAMFEKPGLKLTRILPRNENKPQSAEEGFRAFALGHIARKPQEHGRLAAWGPFYQWGVAALMASPSRPEIGVTEAGWELLEAIDGIDFGLPHDPEIAERFFEFLKRRVAHDLWGFQVVFEGAERGDGRVEMSSWVLERMRASFPDGEWKESVAASYAQGYVSRSRLWGLMEPKLIDSKYQLTDLGRRMLERYGTAVAA